MKHIPWILIFTILLQACAVSPQAVSPANQTPVVAAATKTPIPTDTLTPTITATFTATSTATPTETPVPTPDQADILINKMQEGLVFKDAGTFSKKYGSTEWSISVKIEQENIGEMKDGTFVPYITAVNYPPKALQIIMEQLTAQLMWARAREKNDPRYAEFLELAKNKKDPDFSSKLRSLASRLMGSPLQASFEDSDGTTIEKEINGWDIRIMTKARFLAKAQELESEGKSDFIGLVIDAENGKIYSGSIMTVKDNHLVVYFFYEGTGRTEKILERQTRATTNAEWVNSSLFMLSTLPPFIPLFICDGCGSTYSWVYVQYSDLRDLLTQQEFDSLIVE